MRSLACYQPGIENKTVNVFTCGQIWSTLNGDKHIPGIEIVTAAMTAHVLGQLLVSVANKT